MKLSVWVRVALLPKRGVGITSGVGGGRLATPVSATRAGFVDGGAGGCDDSGAGGFGDDSMSVCTLLAEIVFETDVLLGPSPCFSGFEPRSGCVDSGGGAFAVWGGGFVVLGVMGERAARFLVTVFRGKAVVEAGRA